MDLNTFIPKYIKQTIAERDKGIITADKWNELWNLNITQGDYNSEALTDSIALLLTLQSSNTNHIANTANPHAVTKVQVGLGNVADVLQASQVDFIAHSTSTTNPHLVTKAQVGLGNADNTADNTKNVLSATRLTTPRMIGGASFDGTADITAAQIGVYTRTELQTAGQSVVDWGNIANKPNLADASWKTPVATFANLPTVGNTIGDQRVVLNDGDGKQAVYLCVAITGTIDQQWDKVGDVDWMSEEQTRITNENARVSAENTRISNEATRVNNEATRNTAEVTRITNETNRQAHIIATNNPHSTTKAQVGLGNVDNTSDIDKPVSTAQNTAIAAKLSAVVNDTAPQLGGELNTNGKSIGGPLFDNGNSGTAKTIDWRKGNHQKITMTGNCVFTFTAPTNPGALTLRITQDSTGGRTITLPTYHTANGAPVSFTTTANAVDILTMLYDGTNYHCQVMNNTKVVV